MQPARYPAMLRMIEAGRLRPGRLVKGTVPIEGATDVLASMSESGPIGTRVINQW